MLRFNTSARLTTHSWGWFERGWSSAAPGGICELLLRPACLRILLQCISLFKLCHLLCPVAHNFPFASVSLVQLCSRLQTRVWCQRPWAHREIEGGGGASDASVITRCHVKTRKTHARLVWWTVAGGSAGPQNVYALLSLIRDLQPPRWSRDKQAVSMRWGMKCAFLFTSSSQVSPPPLQQRFHNIQSHMLYTAGRNSEDSK